MSNIIKVNCDRFYNSEHDCGPFFQWHCYKNKNKEYAIIYGSHFLFNYFINSLKFAQYNFLYNKKMYFICG